MSWGESGSVLVSIWFWKVSSSQINSDVPHSDSGRLLRFLEVASHVLNGIWQVRLCLWLRSSPISQMVSVCQRKCRSCSLQSTLWGSSSLCNGAKTSENTPAEDKEEPSRFSMYGIGLLLPHFFPLGVTETFSMRQHLPLTTFLHHLNSFHCSHHCSPPWLYLGWLQSISALSLT